MAGKIYTLRCENCGANVTAQEGKDIMYCQHCGTKLVLVKQGTTSHDAEIAKAKSLEAIRIKELEMRNKELEAKAKAFDVFIKNYKDYCFVDCWEIDTTAHKKEY